MVSLKYNLLNCQLKSLIKPRRFKYETSSRSRCKFSSRRLVTGQRNTTGSRRSKNALRRKDRNGMGMREARGKTETAIGRRGHAPSRQRSTSLTSCHRRPCRRRFSNPPNSGSSGFCCRGLEGNVDSSHIRPACVSTAVSCRVLDVIRRILRIHDRRCGATPSIWFHVKALLRSYAKSSSGNPTILHFPRVD